MTVDKSVILPIIQVTLYVQEQITLRQEKYVSDQPVPKGPVFVKGDTFRNMVHVKRNPSSGKSAS